MTVQKRKRRIMLAIIIFILVTIYWFYIQANLYKFVYAHQPLYNDDFSVFIRWLISSPITEPLLPCEMIGGSRFTCGPY